MENPLSNPHISSRNSRLSSYEAHIDTVRIIILCSQSLACEHGPHKVKHQCLRESEMRSLESNGDASASCQWERPRSSSLTRLCIFYFLRSVSVNNKPHKNTTHTKTHTHTKHEKKCVIHIKKIA